MGKQYNGDATLKGNLDVIAKKPLDSRSVVKTVDDLLDFDDVYQGMTVTVSTEGKIYVLMDENKASTIEGWKEASNGGNGSDVDLSGYTTKKEFDDYKTEASNDLEAATTNIGTEKIADSAITEDKLADEVKEKLNNQSGGDVDLSSYAKKTDLDVLATKDELNAETTNIGTEKIANNAITESKLSAEVTEKLNKIVSSGGTNAICITEAKYNAMETHDANTLYLIKK